MKYQRSIQYQICTIAELDIIYSNEVFLLLTYIEDRFKDKKFLLILFILMLIVNAFEISYNTLTILLRITNTDDILWVFILKKSSALIHTVVVQLLSWTTFVKVKSKTIIFY